MFCPYGIWACQTKGGEEINLAESLDGHRLIVLLPLLQIQ
jgi:hypothetical protein